MTTGRAFLSVDPAPEAPESDAPALRARLLDTRLAMFERMRAIFSLRTIGTPAALDAICDGMLLDGSALLRHECAYVLGQLQEPRSIPALTRAIATDPNPMVRHEACEALGNMGREEVIPTLERARDNDPAIEVRESCEVALDNIRYLRDPRQF